MRSAHKKAFLADNDWGQAEVKPLAGDASNRKYDRLYMGDKTAILMDADPKLGENISPFLAVTHWLRAHDFNAPEIFAADVENGFILLQDFGDALFARAIRDNTVSEQDAYTAALAVLVRLNQYDCPKEISGYGVTHTIAPYNQATYDREAKLCLDWYAPATGARVSGSDFEDILTRVCAPYTNGATLCLRDYHAENLIWLGHGNDIGLLDYQDALRGMPEYDLVSLTEDARRDVSPQVQKTLITEFANQCDKPRPDVEAACAVLSAQRNLKILGIFVRLYVRDNKTNYLKYLPRVWSYLQQDLQHDALTELRRWVDETLVAPDVYLEKTYASS